MKNVSKLIFIVFLGLFAAIIVYPFMHEAGHFIAAVILGVKVYEFNLFPLPNVLCEFDLAKRESVGFVGLGGLIFPAILTILWSPKKFSLWYVWFATKGVCVLSFVLSFWSLILYKTELAICDNDMTQAMRFVPENQMIYMLVIITFLVITILQMIHSRPIEKCLKYFDS